MTRRVALVTDTTRPQAGLLPQPRSPNTPLTRGNGTSVRAKWRHLVLGVWRADVGAATDMDSADEA